MINAVDATFMYEPGYSFDVGLPGMSLCAVEGPSGEIALVASSETMGVLDAAGATEAEQAAFSVAEDFVLSAVESHACRGFQVHSEAYRAGVVDGIRAAALEILEGAALSAALGACDSATQAFPPHPSRSRGVPGSAVSLASFPALSPVELRYGDDGELLAADARVDLPGAGWVLTSVINGMVRGHCVAGVDVEAPGYGEGFRHALAAVSTPGPEAPAL